MLQDQLVEDSLHAGLSAAPQGRVGEVKDDTTENRSTSETTAQRVHVHAGVTA